MPVPDATAVGPLDDGALRPARTQVLLRGGCLLLLFAVLLSLGIALAPIMADGLGLARRVEATVVSVTSVPGDAPRSCPKNRIAVTWDGGRSGTAELCRTADGAHPAVGGTVPIRELPGWDRVLMGSRAAHSVLAAVLIAALLATGGAVLIYLRQLRALAAAGRRPVTGQALTVRKDRMRAVHRHHTMVRLRFDDAGTRPVRLLVPESVDQSLRWTGAELYPLRRTIRGRPVGPYVLCPTAAGIPPIVGLGRAIRTRPSR